MNWNIKLFELNNGKVPVLEYITSLPAKNQAKIYREINLLEEHGLNLTYPHTKKIEGDQYSGLWELRIKFASDASRIFYFTHINNTFVLLHDFSKKTDKTPKRELEQAVSYMKDFLKRGEK